MRQAVLDAVRSAGTPVGPRDIATATGVPSQNVRALLQRLVRELAVKRVGYGKYALMRLSDLPKPRCIDELHPRHFR